MYNESQKMGYVELASKTTPEQAIKRVKSLFNAIENFEKDKQMDICNLPKDEYIDVILQNKKVDRLSYLTELYNILIDYREYCESQQLVDPNAYMAQIGIKKLTKTQLNEKLIEYKKQKQVSDIKTPESLLAFLKDNVFKNANYYVDGKRIHSDALYVIIYLLSFFGITGEEIIKLKRHDIKIEEDNRAKIISQGEEYEIHGEIVPILRNYLSAESVDFKNVKKQIRAIDPEHPFVISGIDNNFANEYRRHYQIIRRRCTNSGVNIPTIAEMSYKGRIYNTCRAAKFAYDNKEITNPLELSDDEIAKIYTSSNHLDERNSIRRNTNNQSRYEIIDAFKSTYKYLDQNNMW